MARTTWTVWSLGGAPGVARLAVRTDATDAEAVALVHAAPVTLEALVRCVDILQWYHDGAACENPANCGHCLAVGVAKEAFRANGLPMPHESAPAWWPTVHGAYLAAVPECPLGYRGANRADDAGDRCTWCGDVAAFETGGGAQPVTAACAPCRGAADVRHEAEGEPVPVWRSLERAESAAE